MNNYEFNIAPLTDEQLRWKIESFDYTVVLLIKTLDKINSNYFWDFKQEKLVRGLRQSHHECAVAFRTSFTFDQINARPEFNMYTKIGTLSFVGQSSIIPHADYYGLNSTNSEVEQHVKFVIQKINTINHAVGVLNYFRTCANLLFLYIDISV